MLSGIVAMTRNEKVMGKDNALPWHLPGDLKFFKSTTLGHRIIMGRKTFDSIGAKVLPKRENWVLSRSDVSIQTDAVFFRSKEDVLRQLKKSGEAKKTFIIGGAEVFKIFWPEIDEIFVTWVEDSYEGDIQFPDLDWSSFHCLSERREIEPVPHTFCHYMRNS